MDSIGPDGRSYNEREIPKLQKSLIRGDESSRRPLSTSRGIPDSRNKISFVCFRRDSLQSAVIVDQRSRMGEFEYDAKGPVARHNRYRQLIYTGFEMQRESDV
jgi:hypothetical protein